MYPEQISNSDVRLSQVGVFLGRALAVTPEELTPERVAEYSDALMTRAEQLGATLEPGTPEARAHDLHVDVLGVLLSGGQNADVQRVLQERGFGHPHRSVAFGVAKSVTAWVQDKLWEAYDDVHSENEVVVAKVVEPAKRMVAEVVERAPEVEQAPQAAPKPAPVASPTPQSKPVAKTPAAAKPRSTTSPKPKKQTPRPKVEDRPAPAVEVDSDNMGEFDREAEPDLSTIAPEEATLATDEEVMQVAAEEGATTDLLRLYLNQIRKIPLLNAEQEVELAKRIEAGVYAGMLLKLRSENLLERQTAEKELYRALIWKQGGFSTTKDINKVHPSEMEKYRKQVRPAAEACIKKALSQSPQELKDLKWLARDGEKAKDHLAEANLRLVVSLAKRQRYKGLPFLDLISEGNIGLMHAIEKFDYTKGYKFSTYAVWWIRQSFTRALADKGRTIRIPVHIDEALRKVYGVKMRLIGELGREPSNEEIGIRANIAPSEVEELLSHPIPISLDQPLSDDSNSITLGELIEDGDSDLDEMVLAGETRRVIEEVLMGLSGRDAQIIRWRFGLDGEARSGEWIGKRLKLSRQRISQIESAVLEQLRSPEGNESLHALARL